jgi:hypothetical protein
MAHPSGPQPPKRKRGGQPNNVNALTSGKYATRFYEQLVGGAEGQNLERAYTLATDDLHEELAVMRDRLGALMVLIKAGGLQPEKAFAALALTATALCRVAATNYNMRGDQSDQLVDAAAGIIADIKRTMGEE